ncbi:AMP-binding protein, partial [Salmonella enterica]|uniref:AMP-binding protein n=1 Tax=Salmonella enterica TaxID=28901 RepID=UPI003D27CF0E
MIADAGVRRVVTDRGTAEALRDLLAGLDLVVIGEVDEDAAALPLHYLPGQMAYVIYTSGSTGKPKGVAISHGSLSQHMDDFIGTYGIS